MQTLLFIIAYILLSSLSFGQKSIIEGEIKGIDNTEIDIQILPLELSDTPIFSTAHVKNGKFSDTINFNVNAWHLIRIRSNEIDQTLGIESLIDDFKNSEIVFFIRPKDKMYISAEIQKYGIRYDVSGNMISDQHSQTEKQLFPLYAEQNRLTILKSKSSNDEKKIQKLENQIWAITKKIEQVELNIIANHPDWIYSAETLAAFPEDTIAKYFKTFTNEVQNSFFGKYLSKILNAPKIGSTAPEFTLKNETGKNVSLSDFSGKYVVLDFWGTWCGFCIRGIPKMKEYYSKYQDKIEFVSIDCNDTRQAWLKAIDKYELNWINLFTENQEIVDKYGVEGFPTKIIINKEGGVAYRTTGEVDDFYDTLDKLLQ